MLGLRVRRLTLVSRATYGVDRSGSTIDDHLKSVNGLVKWTRSTLELGQAASENARADRFAWIARSA